MDGRSDTSWSPEFSGIIHFISLPQYILRHDLWVEMGGCGRLRKMTQGESHPISLLYQPSRVPTQRESPNSRPTTLKRIRFFSFASAQNKELARWLANINDSHLYSINCITKKFPFINSKGWLEITWRVFTGTTKRRTVQAISRIWILTTPALE